MRILIVEDDLEAAEAMARGLTEAGHDITRGADGEEGLAAARDGEFDVMVVDRMMPKMDGVQLVETLRREADAGVATTREARMRSKSTRLNSSHESTSRMPSSA